MTGRTMKKEWKDFEEERTGARSKALVLLTDLDRTESELRSRLRRSGFSDEAADDAITYVKSYGYVDDLRYARRYAEQKSAERGLRRIAADLAQKGVAKDIIEEVCAEHEGLDERPAIRAIAIKRTKGADLNDPKTYNRIAAYLARRGFSTADIISVLRGLYIDE